MKNNTALWPLLLAVSLTVIYKLGDSFVVNRLIVSPELVTSILVYLTLGALVGLLINYILCQTPLGKLVDKSFESIHGMSKQAHVTALVSGVFGAIATGIYLWSFTKLDPAVVIPLTSLSILYIALFETIRGKTEWRKVLPSILLVLAGVGIASYFEIASWVSTGGVLVAVFVVQNLAKAISEVVSKDGVDVSDSVSFGFWRFFWLTVAGVIIAISLSILLGTFTVYTQLIISSLNLTTLLFISILMIVVFFANALANRGLALSDATTTNVVMSGQIILSVFATALVVLIVPGLLPAVSGNLLHWILRILGAVLLTIGVIRLRK